MGSRDGPHQVVSTTPLGFSYRSTAPPLLPGATTRREPIELTAPASIIELALSKHDHAA